MVIGRDKIGWVMMIEHLAGVFGYQLKGKYKST